MLENSYDASGIKFGIIMSMQFRNFSNEINTSDEKKKKESIKKLLYGRNYQIIDFKEIDGLTLEEVLNLNDRQLSDTVLFIMYSSIQYETSQNVKLKDISNIEIIPIQKTDKNKDKQIDEVIINDILKDYDSKDESYKRKVRCFLQRYKYATKEKTDEIIIEKVYKKEQ
jgi:hypothetical protein